MNEAVERLRSGDVVAFATETVYGLGADIRNLEAIQKIFNVKGRPSDNPLIVHIASIDQVWELAKDISPVARIWMETFWPGPLTLVLPKQDWVPDAVTAGLGSVALRVPAHPLALELLRQTGPLAAPSANRSGGPSPTKAEHVEADFEGLVAVLDGGPCQIGLESTVVDCSVSQGEPFRILRPGAITAQTLKQAALVGLEELDENLNGESVRVLPNEDLNDRETEKGVQSIQAKSPGMRYTHYRPKATVRWLTSEMVVGEAATGETVGAVSPDLISAIHSADQSPCLFILHSVTESEGLNNRLVNVRGDYSTMASLLYDLFRWADQMGLKDIWVEPLPSDSTHGMIPALRNRLTKAIGS